MAGESAPAEGAVSGANRRAAIEVTVDQRWDAMALCELLVPFNSYLVQYTPERWVVRGRAPGCHGESLDGALAAIASWQAARGIEAAAVKVEHGEDDT